MDDNYLISEPDPETGKYVTRPMTAAERADLDAARAEMLPLPELDAQPVQARLADALDALPEGPLTKKDLADVIATLRGNDA